MAITLVTAYTDPAQNSYVSLAEAEEYVVGVVDSTAWTAAGTDDEKSSALIAAFRALNRITLWVGTVTTSTQVGAWPRTGVLVPGGFLTVNGPTDGELNSTLTPQGVMDAQVLEALAILETRQDCAAHGRRVRRSQGVQGASVDGLSESVGPPVAYAQRNLTSQEAYHCIRPYIALAGGVVTHPGGRWRFGDDL